MLFCLVYADICFNLQFLYVNQSFAPAPDVDIGTMFDVSLCKDHFHFVVFLSVKLKLVFSDLRKSDVLIRTSELILLLNPVLDATVSVIAE